MISCDKALLLSLAMKYLFFIDRLIFLYFKYKVSLMYWLNLGCTLSRNIRRFQFHNYRDPVIITFTCYIII